jgi:TPR repeat protein
MKLSKLKFLIVIFFIFTNLLTNPGTSYAEISFRVMPDFPYSNYEYFLIESEIKNTQEDIDLIFNIGSKVDSAEIDKDKETCVEESYKNLSEILKRSIVPVFMTPGANVYWNCTNKSQRNQLWQKYFYEFENHWKLKFLVKRQKEQKENFSFFLKNTLFIGINLFEKRDLSDSWFKKLLENNIAWIKQNLEFHQERTNSIVIFAHDFSGLRKENVDYVACGGIQINSWRVHKHYRYFSDQFVGLANKFGKPIVYIHDNSQCFSYDTPYLEAKNIKRIDVDKIWKNPFVEIRIDGSEVFLDQRKNKRIDFFIKEANLGDVWSQYFLGLEYLKLMDYKKAKKWLTKAVKKDFRPAQLELGKIFRDEKKYAQALELFNLVTEGNWSYDKNEDLQVDNKTQIPSWKNRIKKFKDKKINDTVFFGYFHIGMSFERGLGVKKNIHKALEYYKLASNLVANASYNIAVIYFNGLAGGKEFVKAKDWCSKGFREGARKCSAMLGYLYFNGLGVNKNYNEAMKWFKLSIKDSTSMFHLAFIYLNGLGIKKNKKIAIKYLKKAAILGKKEAIVILEKLKILPIDKSFVNGS